jgi:GNAT superfamily N-acetyltransferase
MKYDDSYRERLELTDGTEVLLRLTRPQDRHKLAEAFEKLSKASTYSRFMRPKSELTEDDLDYLANIDQYGHLAIGALIASGEREGEGIGIARYIKLENVEAAAEPAVTVIDEFQGLGLGTLLIARLVEAARERGIEWFRATLLNENRKMRSLLSDWGPVEVIDAIGPEMSIEIDIRPQSESENPPAPSDEIDPDTLLTKNTDTPRGVISRLVSMAANGAFSVMSRFWEKDTD